MTKRQPALVQADVTGSLVVAECHSSQPIFRKLRQNHRGMPLVALMGSGSRGVPEEQHLVALAGEAHEGQAIVGGLASGWVAHCKGCQQHRATGAGQGLRETEKLGADLAVVVISGNQTRLPWALTEGVRNHGAEAAQRLREAPVIRRKMSDRSAFGNLHGITRANENLPIARFRNDAQFPSGNKDLLGAVPWHLDPELRPEIFRGDSRCFQHQPAVAHGEKTFSRLHEQGVPGAERQFGRAFHERRNRRAEGDPRPSVVKAQNASTCDAGGTADGSRGAFDIPDCVHGKREQGDVIRNVAIHPRTGEHDDREQCQHRRDGHSSKDAEAPRGRFQQTQSGRPAALEFLAQGVLQEGVFPVKLQKLRLLAEALLKAVEGLGRDIPVKDLLDQMVVVPVHSEVGKWFSVRARCIGAAPRGDCKGWP